MQIVKTYDLSANWWYNLPDQVERGASFPKYWNDQSLIIIARNSDDDISFGRSSVFRPIAWTQPFTPGVWLMLISTLLFSGLISIFLQGKSIQQIKDDAPIKGSMKSAILHNVHKSFILYTGHNSMQSVTHAGQMLTFSLAFFSILMFSIYTANLASFLVIQKSAHQQSVNTVDDIVHLSRSICVYGGHATGQVIIIQRKDPKARLIEKGSDKEALMGLKNKECDYALIGQAVWDLFKGMKEVNKD